MIWLRSLVPLPLSFGVVILGFDGGGTELDHFAAGIKPIVKAVKYCK